MKNTISKLLAFIAAVAITGCSGMTYHSAEYEGELWSTARAYGYNQVFHTHISGYGLCAAVLVSGTGGNSFSAETNAYRQGQRIFNPSIRGVPVLGEVIIDKREVITYESKMFKEGDGRWMVESIIISPLGHHHHHH